MTLEQPASLLLSRDRVRRAPEGGQSLVSSVAAVAVFLGFLLFAVHLTINLYAKSTVTSHAYDAARRVARADIDHDDPGAVGRAQSLAEGDARASLGDYAERIEAFDWSGTDADVVRLRLKVRNPSFLIFGGSALGVETIDRTVTVRVERVR